MPKDTPIDKTKQEERQQAKTDIRDRGAASNEKSVAQLRTRVAILERILSLDFNSQ